ncbi:MAG TPA: 50S ribosomal protein L4 [Acidimicrobiales bacterium]|jgi:large subunit ribosomal protein L4|nr:50S ribosomal protein L4 [Acidimicrobiales bacterium]
MTATSTTPDVTERTGSILGHTMKKDRPAPVQRTGLKRNAAGHDLGTVDLEPTVFGLTPNRAVLHQVVTAQLAAVRAGTQSTKTRAEVRGGGAKPFRQKGTGRARQGSSRSPSMSGGGVALGPKPRSYEQHTPKKMIRLALLSALSDMAETERVVVLTDWEIEEPDTRAAAVTLKKLRVDGSVLCVLANDEIDIALSLRNIPEASITTHAELSAHDVVRADWIVFSERTLPASPSDFSGTHLREAPPAPTKPAKPEADAAPAAKAEKAVPAKKAAKATKAAKAAAADAEKALEAIEAEADVELPAGSDEAPETEASETEASEKPAKKAPARKARAAKKAKEGDADA